MSGCLTPLSVGVIFSLLLLFVSSLSSPSLSYPIPPPSYPNPPQVAAAESTIADMDAARATADEETAALRADLAAAVDNAERSTAAAATAAVQQATLETKKAAEVELSTAQERLRQELAAEKEAALAEGLGAEREAARERVGLAEKEAEDLRARLSKVCASVLAWTGRVDQCVGGLAEALRRTHKGFVQKHVEGCLPRLRLPDCPVLTFDTSRQLLRSLLSRHLLSSLTEKRHTR